MPWKEAVSMDLRTEFVIRARQPVVNVRALCREFGISPKTGYKWLGRHAESGVAGLSDRSRRPRTSPLQIEPRIERRIVALRVRHGWGGKKLAELLLLEGCSVSRSTVDRVLARQGLIREEDRHRPALRRFERKAPNELWQMDWKAPYALSGGGSCTPLSVIDDHSRYAVHLSGHLSTGGEGLKRSLTRAFRECGVPDAILADHGTPWYAGTNGHGLTWVSIWLIKQGIELILSGIRHPQTQGKVERFHRTLDRSLAHWGVNRTLPGLRRQLARFRDEYNTLRPHEALGMEVPASLYIPSTRAYLERPPEWEYPVGAVIQRVNHWGALYIQGTAYFISEALADERVWLREVDGRVLVTYRHMYVREIDLRTGRTTAVVRPVQNANVLPMS